MYKFLFLPSIVFQCWSQKLHHYTFIANNNDISIRLDKITKQDFVQFDSVEIENKGKQLLVQGETHSFGLAKIPSFPLLKKFTQSVYPNSIIKKNCLKFSSKIENSTPNYCFDNSTNLVCNQSIYQNFAFSKPLEVLHFNCLETSFQSFLTKNS